jgi:hypothetical protein
VRAAPLLEEARLCPSVGATRGSTGSASLQRKPTPRGAQEPSPIGLAGKRKVPERRGGPGYLEPESGTQVVGVARALRFRTSRLVKAILGAPGTLSTLSAGRDAAYLRAPVLGRCPCGPAIFAPAVPRSPRSHRSHRRHRTHRSGRAAPVNAAR